jgi:hypothetical protein
VYSPTTLVLDEKKWIKKYIQKLCDLIFFSINKLPIIQLAKQVWYWQL